MLVDAGCLRCAHHGAYGVFTTVLTVCPHGANGVLIGEEGALSQTVGCTRSKVREEPIWVGIME